MRILISIVGLATVYLAILAGTGISYLLEYYKSDMSETIPFLMLGIGIDDMFVICNSVDQTPLNQPASKRIRSAMYHAGPSITITSLTNAFAFLAGSGSSIVAVESFCIHCTFSILMLYTAVLTIFLPMLYWDTIRVEKRWKELCGLCFCDDNSVIFCKGKLMSENQKVFSGHYNNADAQVV